MQRAGADVGQLGLEPRAQRRVRTGELEVFERRAYVEAGTADQQRHPAAGQDVVDRGPGEPLVFGDAGRLRDRPDVEHVMRRCRGAPPA